jgi:5-methylcytosine-specific restriction endonuclease McrA
MLDPSLQELVQSLIKSTKQTDKVLVSLKEIAERIDGRYEPRVQFERWRDSVDGKSWKQQKFDMQKGLCAICNQTIKLKGSHIDHKQPISLNPELALDLKNLQITCSDCNTSKGSKIV